VRAPRSKLGEPSSTVWVRTTFSRSIGRSAPNIAAWCTKHPASISPVWTQTAGRIVPNHQPASSSAF